MKIEIRTPQSLEEWEKYYDLRYRILRKPLNQPKGSEKNDGDQIGIHFALYQEKVLQAVVRLDLQENHTAQVRFMAVEENQQKKGFGKKIMIEIENYCLKNNIQKIILHARDHAVDFYFKLGYKVIEPSHKLFGIIQHFLMEKYLIS